MSPRPLPPMDDLPFERVDEERIDPSDETFRVRRRYVPSLLASVRERGIRTPLLVQPGAASFGEPDGDFGGEAARASCGFRIVSGWGRWIGRPRGAKVPCFIISGGLSAQETWDAFLGDNETWNAAEIGRILAALEALGDLDEERIVREKLPLLGVHPSVELHLRYRRLADLGPAASALVEEEDLPLRRAAVLLRLPTEAIDVLVGAARELQLTLNELGETIEWVEEVAARDGLGPAAVLSLARTAAACPGKDAFRATLHALRYPELTRLRDRLEERRARLRLPAGARVQWDPHLERPGIRLVADLPDAEALAALRGALDREVAGLEALFEVL